MIILMSQSEICEQGAKALQTQSPSITTMYFLDEQFDLATVKSHDIYIVDLDADGNFINFSSERLSQFLIDKNLPKSVTHIYLVVSDVNDKYTLVSYASELYAALKKAGYDLSVHVPTDLTSKLTLLSPSEKNDGSWKIYGSDESASDYASCLKLNKNILFEGKNIGEWFNQPARTLDKQSCKFDNQNDILRKSFSSYLK